ncbi:MAG: hypothetical protein ACI9S6_003644, partial [Reinekea sp.]
ATQNRAGFLHASVNGREIAPALTAKQFAPNYLIKPLLT